MKNKGLAVPYVVWMAIFVVAPLILVVIYAFHDGSRFTLDNFRVMYQDKTLVCKDCGQEFTFSASEQEFFAEKGFTNEPQRCKACRNARKQNSRGDRGERQMYDAVCSECGRPCKIPFQPREDRPVYCSECFGRR